MGALPLRMFPQAENTCRGVRLGLDCWDCIYNLDAGEGLLSLKKRVGPIGESNTAHGLSTTGEPSPTAPPGMTRTNKGDTNGRARNFSGLYRYICKVANVFYFLAAFSRASRSATSRLNPSGRWSPN